MKKLFLILLFVICVNFTSQAMEKDFCSSHQTATINGKEISKEVIKSMIRKLIKKQPSLAKEKHRDSLCIITNLLIEEVEKQISQKQIAETRKAKRDSMCRILELMGPDAIQAGNEIFHLILEVFGELEE